MPRSPAKAPEVEIRLLGRFEVVRGSEPLPLPASKKSRALLAYLVATARSHLREQLCELLWEAPDDPRASLRWSLAKVRPLVDDADTKRLTTDRDEVAFEPKGAKVDVVTLRADLSGGPLVASIASLRRAALVFRGEFLEGLELTGCYRYHEWWIGERERMRALRVSVLGQLIERLHDTPDEALEYARQLLSLDPLSEAAHIQLIRLLGAMGKTREAVAQYERCKRVLLAELGREPSADLKLARMSVSPARSSPSSDGSSQEASPPRSSSPPDSAYVAVPDSIQTPKLVGRKRELAKLEAMVLDTLAAKEHGGIEVVGEPGIGKTRMLEELARAVKKTGGLVLFGRAFEAETVRPYGAWIDALRSVRRPELTPAVRADLLPLLPELGVAPPLAGDRNRLFDAVTHLLSALAKPSAPCLVILDDLQWFDEASAALLHFAIRALSRSRVLFAFGARPSELHDNPVAQRLLRSLTRERRLLEIVLGPLAEDETMELVRAVAGEVEAERVFVESEGNPFFALEIARALASGDEPMSTSFEQLVSDRFDRVGAQARALLPWAAALGRSFRSHLLGDVAPLAAIDLDAGIEELERRGILRSASSPDGSTTYDFSHDLIRQAAYRQTSEPRKRLLHLQIARAMSKAPDPTGAMAADVAHHAALGGDDELCARACITAGERCIRIFANAEAQALADRGRQRLDRLAPQIRIPLHLGLLRLSVEAGMWRTCARELESELTRAVAEAQSVGLSAEVARGWELLSEVHEELGDFRKAQKSIVLSERASRDTDPATRARAIARAGRCLAQFEREIPRAEALLEEATQLCTSIRVDLPDISMGLGLIEYQRGDYESAERLLEKGWKTAELLPDHWLAYESLSRLVMLLLERGSADVALSRCSELEPLAKKLGEGSEVPFAATLKALARLALGVPEAPGEVDRALDSLRAIDTKGHLAYASNFVADIEIASGALDRAKRRAEEALTAAEVIGRRTEVARARSLLSRIALMSGDIDSARAHIEAVRADLADPLVLAASARHAILAGASELGMVMSVELANLPVVPAAGLFEKEN
jgi:DNA-binding SARP family transcriptional activator